MRLPILHAVHVEVNVVLLRHLHVLTAQALDLQPRGGGRAPAVVQDADPAGEGIVAKVGLESLWPPRVGAPLPGVDGSLVLDVGVVGHGLAGVGVVPVL